MKEKGQNKLVGTLGIYSHSLIKTGIMLNYDEERGHAFIQLISKPLKNTVLYSFKAFLCSVHIKHTPSEQQMYNI